jgi:hypothetical protein
MFKQKSAANSNVEHSGRPTAHRVNTLPVDVFADADEAVSVLEEHLLQRDHHALEVPRPLLDVVADLQCAIQHVQGQY